MRFVHRQDTNVYRLLTFLTPLKNKIMKNAQITTKLNRMMADEKRAKLDAITCIIDNYRDTAPHLVNSDTFDELYELDIAQLNDIMSDLIAEMYASINQKITEISNKLNNL